MLTFPAAGILALHALTYQKVRRGSYWFQFVIRVGVKQGDAIFFILLEVYMYDIYLRLKDYKSGCHIGYLYVNLFLA